ncbi:unnamed protein product [Allacma fusca]|uniref:Uncharacterized protein n=1 Tax=Allacma fusca TaxID=39272 RepID=A0A8J2KMY5_9HEXA|nr:unnamed protein product [Allacma fusca]
MTRCFGTLINNSERIYIHSLAERIVGSSRIPGSIDIPRAMRSSENSNNMPDDMCFTDVHLLGNNLRRSIQ